MHLKGNWTGLPDGERWLGENGYLLVSEEEADVVLWRVCGPLTELLPQPAFANGYPRTLRDKTLVLFVSALSTEEAIQRSVLSDASGVFFRDAILYPYHKDELLEAVANFVQLLKKQ